MTSRSDIERVLDRYLAEGAEQVPDRVIDAALDQVDQIPQRRALRVPWRFNGMPTALKSALAGAAVIAVIVIGGVFMTRDPATDVGGPPIATASPAASAVPSTSPSPSRPPALTDTSNWVTFTSSRYGYQIGHPPSWVATPATGEWTFETSRLDFRTPDADTIIDESSVYPIRFTAFAFDIPPNMSDEEWIAAYYEGAPPACLTPIEDMQPVSVDGHAGRIAISDACSDAQAFIPIDGQVHVFAVWREKQILLLEAFLSTVKFTE